MADTKEIYIVGGEDLGNIADAIRTLKNEGEDSTYSVKDMSGALEPANNPLSLTVNQGKITASVTGLAKIGKSVSDTSSDCKSENIRSGKTILGVQGTYTAADVSLDGKIVIDYNNLEAKTNGDNVSLDESTKLIEGSVETSSNVAEDRDDPDVTLLLISYRVNKTGVLKEEKNRTVISLTTEAKNLIKDNVSTSLEINGQPGGITDLTKSTSITFPRQTQ